MDVQRCGGLPFNVSCDNLNGDYEPDRIAFQRQVHAQVMHYLENGIPARPARFIAELQRFITRPADGGAVSRRKICAERRRDLMRN